VSSATPCFRRQAGQSPASAPTGSRVPHCGHFGLSGGVTLVLLIHPIQKQITMDVTEKVLETFNIQHRMNPLTFDSMLDVEHWVFDVSPQPKPALKHHFRHRHD
jgi:hypothetical protein